MNSAHPPSPHPVAALGLSRWLTAVGLVASALAGCHREPPTADFERRCAGGDRAACSQACKAGVLGENGCMAALKDNNPMRRAQMLGRACQAQVKPACLPAAEASIALNLNQYEQYQSLLTQGCQLKSRDACNKLGDFLLLDSLNDARQRYLEACKLEKEPGPCVTSVTSRLRALEANQAKCRANDALACERVLLSTATRNQDLAYDAASRICQQRGLSQYYASNRISYAYKLRQQLKSYEACGLFLVARATGSPPIPLSFSRKPIPTGEPVAKRGAIEVEQIKFHFGQAPALEPALLSAAQDAVKRQMEDRLDSARRCFNGVPAGHPAKTGELNFTFLVDRLGEPVEVRTSSDLVDHELRECLASALIPEHFTGKVNDLGSVVRVEAVVALH